MSAEEIDALQEPSRRPVRENDRSEWKLTITVKRHDPEQNSALLEQQLSSRSHLVRCRHIS